ncbi:AAA family ATPase [Streptomyces ipomoeae]|uniref:AAA family ATPase n=1 Tax=Streptomyces ipomoeae TaxID=103232 RepID=UPI0015EFFBE9|nr:AAA family ATPase [Streptomyces ipomoeae]MDX2931485.1 AAA family ATPase [Streptomyces ipomoeae]
MKPSGRERERDTGADHHPTVTEGPDRVGAGLLEREEELRRLEGAIAGAKAGTGTVVAVEGSAGNGRTRLLRAAMERAAVSGMAVVSARGGQMETEFAFGIARRLFGPVLTAAETGEREVLLEGAAAPAMLLPSAAPHIGATGCLSSWTGRCCRSTGHRRHPVLLREEVLLVEADPHM